MRRFWIVAALGSAFLTYDELGMGHENVDKYLHLVLGWRATEESFKIVVEALHRGGAARGAHRESSTPRR